MSTMVDQFIFEPGIYDLPDDLYHSDPVVGGSLSVSGAKKLLPPSCPARFAYEREHGQPHKADFDFGHAIHKLVLGTGPEIWVVDADDWRTADARKQRSEAYDAGQVPLLRADHDAVQEMAEALQRHPFAAALFDPENGVPEQSMFWRDKPTGVMLRGRVDWLTSGASGRLIIPDYKSCRSANNDALQRAMYDYGYYMQAPWYLDGVLELTDADDAAFVFVCQEKTPPYLVNVVELDTTAMRIGRERNRQAIEIYAACTAEGAWPGYSNQVELLSLPRWAETAHLQEAW